MKTFYSFFAFLVFFSSFVNAQDVKNSQRPKSGEQHEVKATNHLKKELEQKQLSTSPERIADTTAARQSIDRKKNKKCSRISNKSGKKK